MHMSEILRNFINVIEEAQQFNEGDTIRSNLGALQQEMPSAYKILAPLVAKAEAMEDEKVGSAVVNVISHMAAFRDRDNFPPRLNRNPQLAVAKVERLLYNANVTKEEVGPEMFKALVSGAEAIAYYHN